MLYVYNTLSRKKEVFKPRHKNKVAMFVCGITPYDSPHIGNLRTFVNYDLIAKYLRFKGYDLFYLQNITDIDDKIIQRAGEKEENWKRLGKRYFKELQDVQKKVNVNSVNKYAKATDHIDDIIKQIKTLLKKKYAYESGGGIFFDITKFKEYGKLSGQSLKALQKAERTEEDADKKHPYDFALWKPKKTGEPSWPSPFGPGRPGWHIEDTAITEHYYGSQYDLHGGALDLIFPHHECEIAQQEAASGKKPFVKYWLHSGFLNVNGEKMSKSLGNFITAKKALEKYEPNAVRFMMISVHYRSPINYSKDTIFQAQNTLEKIYDFSDKLSIRALAKQSKSTDKEINIFIKIFFENMDDDFNTPKAIASLFELITYINKRITKNPLSKEEQREICAFLKNVEKIFGVKLSRKKEKKIPQDVLNLLSDREKFRKEKNWPEADKAREAILSRGYIVEDTTEGQKFKKA